MRHECRNDASHVPRPGENIQGRETSKCKGPEVGTFLICSRNSKEATLLPILRERGHGEKG